MFWTNNLFIVTLIMCVSITNLIYAQKLDRKAEYKSNKLQNLIAEVMETNYVPFFLQPESWCKSPNSAGPVVFAAALMKDLGKLWIILFKCTLCSCWIIVLYYSIVLYYNITVISRHNTIGPRYTKSFVQSLRNTGYGGDILVATLRDLKSESMEVLKRCDSIVYPIDLTCTGSGNAVKKCQFRGVAGSGYPMAMIRFYLYKWWSTFYDKNALVLLSDFKDVFFQSDPFSYIPGHWAPPLYQLTVFQEAYPNRMIYRNAMNKGFIGNCYGSGALNSIAFNQISSVGSVFGTMDAIFAYVSNLLLLLLLLFFHLLFILNSFFNEVLLLYDVIIYEYSHI